MPENPDQLKKLAKEVEDWAAKQKLLQLSEISLVLDSYDSIFSDFDPRTFDRRALSDDFLAELKRASKEKKSGVIEINFLIPLEKKKEETESKIRKRLREHFKRHYDLTKKEIDRVRTKGVIMVIVGLILSIIAAVFIYPNESNNILSNIILVLIEPAAWFTIWEGANKVFDTWKYLEQDLEFYRKMIKCEISFTAY
jgi:hypothetical protein